MEVAKKQEVESTEEEPHVTINPFLAKKKKVEKFAKKRRSKNKNNKVAKKPKVGNTEGDPHATIKTPFLSKKQKVETKTAEKCRSKKRKVKFHPVKFYDKPRPKVPLRIDWVAVSDARRKGINLLGEIISKFKIQRARELEEWKEKKRAREEEEKKEKKSRKHCY